MSMVSRCADAGRALRARMASDASIFIVVDGFGGLLHGFQEAVGMGLEFWRKVKKI